jgi:hypothetical protein
MSRLEEIEKKLKKAYRTLLITSDPNVQELLEDLIKKLIEEKQSMTINNNNVQAPVTITTNTIVQEQSAKHAIPTTPSPKDERKEIEKNLLREVSGRGSKGIATFKLAPKSLSLVFKDALDTI